MDTNTNGTRYNSLCDWSTWLMVFFVMAGVLWPLMIDGDTIYRLILIGIAVAFVILEVILYKGTYYCITDDSLVVYVFFKPTVLPIDKIESVLPTRSLLSAPATSLAHRLAIKFSDRKVLKSSMPLIISPVRQQAFIAQLVSINPNIRTQNN